MTPMDRKGVQVGISTTVTLVLKALGFAFMVDMAVF